MKITRAVLAAAILVVAAAACQVDVTVDTVIAKDGSGTFKLEFALDRELVDLARNAGQDPAAPLTDLSENLQRAGWRVTRSTPGGGVSVAIERRFSSPDELNRALAALEQEPAGPAPGFFHVTVDQSSSFLRSQSSFDGTIDLTTDRLLSESDLPEATKNTLRPIVEQAAGEFLRFVVRVTLPGDVSKSTGDPDEVRGGTVTWTPGLGRTVRLTAGSSAFKPSGFVVLGVPVAIAIALAVLLLRRRGRRA